MTRHAVPSAPRRRGTWAAIVVTGLVLAGAGAALAGTDLFRTASAPAAEAPTTSARASTPTPTPTPPPDAEFTLVAAGDVLLHEPVIASARTADGYDFAPLLAPIEPWVAGADLALCHLEVPVAPQGVKPSGYPLFGAPEQIAGSLAANGWDGCSTASNHSVDRGFAGVEATLAALDEAGLGHVGTARTAGEGAAPQVYELEREGQTIRVAQIAATYGTNGMPVPEDAPWAVTLIDAEALVEQARQARTDGADVVVASIHCCVEYVSDPTDEQLELATALAESGEVDLLIGHHAHVPQPIARLDGGPGDDGMWVAYGLGNLISNQDGDCCTPRTDSGLLMTATFRKPADGPARVTGVEWTAVTVDRSGGHLVHAMTSDAAGVGTVSAAQVATRRDRVLPVVGTDAAERRSAPEPTGPVPVVVPRDAQIPSTGSD